MHVYSIGTNKYHTVLYYNAIQYYHMSKLLGLQPIRLGKDKPIQLGVTLLDNKIIESQLLCVFFRRRSFVGGASRPTLCQACRLK